MTPESNPKSAFPESNLSSTKHHKDNPRKTQYSTRGAEKLLATLCLLLLIVSAAFSSKEIGFGPRIKGAQLGVKMSLNELVTFLIDLERLPFTLDINDSKQIKANNRPSKLNSISIAINGTGKEFKDFRVISATNDFAIYRKMKLTLEELLNEIENAGVISSNVFTGSGYVKRYADDTLTFDEDRRINSIRFYKKDFGATAIDGDIFLSEFTKIYNIPYRGIIGRTWHYKNEAEGWQINYYDTISEGIIKLEVL